MLQPLALDYDGRLDAFCITVKANYGWFLEKTEGAEENLEIQRKIIKSSKAYATLRQDLKRGCVLPPVVLSVRNVDFERPHTTTRTSEIDTFDESLLAGLSTQIEHINPNDVFIIDGLQRTNALRQVRQELEGTDLVHFERSPLRIEIWLNIPFGAIAYRMLLLNAGQKPMSMKHQVEVLSRHLIDDLRDIAGIDIFTSTESRRRYRGGQFQLAKIAQAFQAWLQGSPNIDVSNVVMQELLAESAIETLGKSVGGRSSIRRADSFHEFMRWVVDLDQLLVDGVDFFGNETVLQGIAAAVGSAQRNEALSERVQEALPALLERVRRSPGDDPLAIETFRALRKGFDPSKRNVGVATRELVFQSFQEFFVSRGTKSMEECWRFAAAMSKA